MSSPTWNETKIARRLLRRRLPMDRIVSVLKGKYAAAQITDAVIAQRAKEKDHTRKMFDKVCGASAIQKITELTIPAHVIAERTKRMMLVPRDTTALRMGDPLPGYSALETAPSIAPVRTRRDHLDDLIYARRRVTAG